MRYYTNLVALSYIIFQLQLIRYIQDFAQKGKMWLVVLHSNEKPLGNEKSLGNEKPLGNEKALGNEKSLGNSMICTLIHIKQY